MWFLIFIVAPIVSLSVISYVTNAKFRRPLKILFGFILMLISLPVAFYLEIGLNGCCGAPETGYKNVGFSMGTLVFITGFIIAITSLQRRKS